jgi:mRNA-degrading endonuclease toxin of MazEF toxin-antitoxin module
MGISRGNVCLARFPHASGGAGKKRPVLVVQADAYNQRLRHAVVAQLTTNLSDKDDPACLLIEASSPEGKAAGITRDSVVSGYLISLMSEDRLQNVVGTLPDATMQRVGDCLKSALGLP